MIELLKTPIHSTDTIIELRNKIFLLSYRLKYDEMEAVRIATKASEIIRTMYTNDKEANFSLGFIKAGKTFLLALTFSVCDLNKSLQAKQGLFYNAKYTTLDNDHAELTVELAINDKNFKPTDESLQELREVLIQQSKSEMMSELKQKNEEMTKLIDDIKRSSGLIQSEKMRALGTLTAGVAHELNNPMMGILNFIQYAKKKTPPTERAHEALEDAERETKRCIDIVRNLLTFSHLEKEGEESFKTTNVNTIIERVTKILSYKMRAENVELVLNLAENLPNLEAQENRIQQVMLNIIGNAIDAMKKVEKRKLIIGGTGGENIVRVTITDTGEGMSEETIEQIFEPFFTTKPTGSGTGLGLSLCESIIKDHHGQLFCQSELGHGTTFTITLPIQHAN